jgi:hypothetical protein
MNNNNDNNNIRIQNMNIIQKYYSNNMDNQNKEIGFINFFKTDENVLSYITSTPYKHFFEGAIVNEDSNKEIKYIFKVIPYSKYSSPPNELFSPERPENSEIIIHKLIFDILKSKSFLNILIPYISFITNIDPFIDSSIKNIVGKDNEKYMIFVNKYFENKFHNKVKILISEHGYSLKSFLLKNKNNFTLSDWKILIFQVVLTLALIQENYPSFKHNSLGINSIYVTKNNNVNNDNELNYFEFDNQQFVLKKNEYNFMINNFSLSTIDNLIVNTRTENVFIKELGISNKQNRYYDLHFFLYNILYFCSHNSIYLPHEISEFIHRNIPEKYRLNIKNYNRMIIDEEFITPKEIIKNDTLFFNFRKEINLNICKNTIIEI